MTEDELQVIAATIAAGKLMAQPTSPNNKMPFLGVPWPRTAGEWILLVIMIPVGALIATSVVGIGAGIASLMGVVAGLILRGFG